MALFQSSFFSEALQITASMNVILPQSCTGQIGMDGNASSEPPALLYLLHGLSDDHSTWLRRTSIERYVANLPLVVIMPAVDRSFYTDMAMGNNYWTFISEELPQIVQSFFNVSKDWNKTFVAGLSMGGYGAFKLALTHPDRYAAAASLSGCLDINTITTEEKATEKREYENIFGPLDQLAGSENDLLALLEKLPENTKTKFYQCCGTDDFLYQDNLTFKARAKKSPIDFTYEEHTNKNHNWDYWDQQIQRVLEWLPIEPENA